jgi:DNA polymerase
VLEIRALAGSASIKKLFSIRTRLSDDDRMRDLCIYHGARTGRSTGEGPQPLNTPKAGPDMVACGCGKYYGQHAQACPFCGLPRAPSAKVAEWNPDIAAQALTVIATRSLEWVELVYGEALATIAGCLRALYDAAPGHDLISTDYNSIEAVGLAMLAGEQWRIKVFNTHGNIYLASASTMFSVPLEELLDYKKRTGQHHPLRQKGKIGELAFGYQGWIGAAAAFGMPGTEEEIKNDILRWRAASPAVEWLWGGQEVRKAKQCVDNALQPGYDGTVDSRIVEVTGPAERWDRSEYYFGVEGMAVLAVLEPTTWHPVTRLDGTDSGISFMFDTTTRRLYCWLPSGRALTYHAVRLEKSDRGGYSLSYEGWNSNPKNGPPGWIRMSTWGGRLVENINQGTCRDILAPACIALEQRGYPVVLHVYDEIVAEIPETFGSVEEFEEIVTVRPAWANDWPIKAPGGYRAKRYRKG